MRDDADVNNTLFRALGTGKSTENIANSLQTYKTKLTLEDIIASYSFKQCGKRASALCAKILTGQNYSTTSFPAVSYQWALDPNSQEYQTVTDMAQALGISLETPEADNSADDKIPIIMTGDPSKCSEYATKKQWLAAHPQYVETGSWKECKILFTNDLESKTGKMGKALKAGIPIKLYEDKETSTLSKIAHKIYDIINESFSEEHTVQANGLTPYDEELIDEASSTTYPDTIERCINQCDTLKAEYILRDMLQDLYDSGDNEETPDWSDNWGFGRRRRYDD